MNAVGMVGVEAVEEGGLVVFFQSQETDHALLFGAGVAVGDVAFDLVFIEAAFLV